MGKAWSGRERKRRKEGEAESRNVRIASVSSFNFVKTPILMALFGALGVTTCQAISSINFDITLRI